MNFLKLIFFCLPLTLSSCIEIIDDLSLELDGSGCLKFTVNLSASKVKMNSVLSLDSLNGKRVPKIGEIEQQIFKFKEILQKEKGINSVKTDFNNIDFILKISIEFANISDLQSSIKTAISQVSLVENLSEVDSKWISWDGNTLERLVPKIIEQSLKNDKESDLDLLKTGSYTCISRMPKIISKTSNSNCKLNPSRTASMLRVNTLDLKLNPSLLKHTITLSPE